MKYTLRPSNLLTFWTYKTNQLDPKDVAGVVKRLRGKYCCGDDVKCQCDTIADLIEAQTREIAALREELVVRKKASELADFTHSGFADQINEANAFRVKAEARAEAAEAALASAEVK